MKPKSYWQQRSEQIAKRQHLKADRYAYELGREYGRAMQSIQRDIEAFYGRFSENNQINLAEARKLLTAGELREFKMTLEEFTALAKNNADGRWTRILNNVYYRTRVSRLEALQVQIRQQVEMLAANQQKGMRELLGDVYEDTYYRTLFEIQRGTGIGASFAKIDQRSLEKVLGTEFAGSNWSKRIWNDRDKLARELHVQLTQAFIRGDSVDRTVRIVRERFGVSLSNARRLVQTESAFFTEQATMDSYKASGIVEKYEILATLDSRTSPICQDMDGKVFKLSEMEVGVTYPPFHPNCRTTTVPYFDDEEDAGERIARGTDGQTYYVPGNVTYEQWKKDYVLSEFRDGGTIESYNKELIDAPNYKEKFTGLGLSNKVTNSVVKETRRAIRINDKTPNERGVFINAKTGDVIHQSRGYPYGVTFDERMLDGLPNDTVILTHNHPLGTTFSSDDINTLMALPQIKSMVAGGHNGKVYILSVGKGRRIDGSISAEYNKLRNIFQDDLHKVLETLARENGWEYEVR